MADARLIAVDWGTTSCRASLVAADGGTIAEAGGGPGIVAAAGTGFQAALASMIGHWRAAHPTLPVILSGMIGSRQGWHEVPYASCPAGLADIAAGLVALPGAPSVRIVPGLVTRDEAGMPDVMRGEETQICGALASTGARHGTFVLPGTHAKWAEVRDGRIVAFRTFMTGEVYAALREHTILGRLMPPPGADTAHGNASDDTAFLAGVRLGAASGGPGALLGRIFSARARGLVDDVPGAALADHLSGVLIGAEIAEAAAPGHPVVAIGARDLVARYLAAGHACAIDIVAAPADCAARGAHAILTARDG